MEPSVPPDWQKQLAALQLQVAEQQRIIQKLESLNSQPPPPPAPPSLPVQMSFCDWVKIGFAITLPLLALGALLLIVLLLWSLKYSPHVSPP